MNRDSGKTYHGIAIPLLLLLLAVVAGPALAGDGGVLLLATTTSTDNTGLLDHLAPRFQADTGVTLRWVATGTGKALVLGQNCDADVLLVHAPAAEAAFLAAGYGSHRWPVMYNDFVLVGPPADPAKIRGRPPAAALAAIRSHKALFISRGDDSGTHKKERALWRAAGMAPPERQSWYLESGQGMLATLTMAAERRGYTLADRGTFLTFQATDGTVGDAVVVLVEGFPQLRNQYAVVELAPERCSGPGLHRGHLFARWLTGPAGQAAIGAFRLHGRRLFTPNATGRPAP